MNAVEIMDVTKKYGDRVIFDHINMEIREGEMTALIGPSGCGKSTLLNMIGLLEDFSNGKVRIFGKEIPRINSRKATMLRRNTVNYLFQSSALVGDMTVYQNLMLAMHFVRISQKEKEIRINRMLHEVGLPKMKSAVVNTMSGGEQQMLAMGRALMSKPTLLLLDEPAMGLSPILVNEIFDIIKSINKDGVTVLLVEQNANKALSIADRAYVLETGNVIVSGKANEVANNPKVREAYLG